MNRYTHKAGAFEVTSLPGQSQVAICHSLFVHEAERGQGNAHTLKAYQRHLLAALHYDYALCTVSEHNTAMKIALEQSGWTKLTAFYNHRSSEITELWGTKP